MHLSVSARTGTKPRRRKLQYLEKWNRDSRQDNGIDLVPLWNRLKGPRNKDFLFLDKSCCSLDKTSAVKSCSRSDPCPVWRWDVESGAFAWIIHEHCRVFSGDLLLTNCWIKCFVVIFIFFLPFFLSRSTDINATKFLLQKTLRWQNTKKKIVDCEEMVSAENQTRLGCNNNKHLENYCSYPWNWTVTDLNINSSIRITREPLPKCADTWTGWLPWASFGFHERRKWLWSPKTGANPGLG